MISRARMRGRMTSRPIGKWGKAASRAYNNFLPAFNPRPHNQPLQDLEFHSSCVWWSVVMEEVLSSASTACERLCFNQQRALVACVESIRRNHSDDDTTTKTCLPEAVMAWTKCCEESNLTGHEKAWEREREWLLFNSFLKDDESHSRLLSLTFVKVRTIKFYIRAIKMDECNNIIRRDDLRWIRIPLLDTMVYRPCVLDE